MDGAGRDRGGFAGRRVLVVEDDYMIATDLAETLRNAGIEVIGPVPSVESALRLIQAAPAMDGALLDVNLRGELSFPVADALRERGVPFVFATGYDEGVIPARHARVTRCEKPLDPARVMRALFP